MKLKILMFLFILLLSNNLFSDNVNQIENQVLNFDVIKAKEMEVEALITIPINIERYSENGSFILKTPVFINTRTQRVDLEAYYYNQGEKIHAVFETDDLDNRFAIFEINNINQNTYNFYISAKINSQNNITYLNEEYDLSNEILEYDVYKQPTRYINSDKSEIRTVSNHIKESNNALREITNITNWVYTFMEYDISYSTQLLESTRVLSERKGVCSEYAILAAAILRERGIPTRYVSGYANSTVEWEAHAWLEVYIPNQGWIPVDPTFAEVGFVDASHLLVSRSKDPYDIKDRVTAYGDVILSFGERSFDFNIINHKSYSDLGYNNAISVNLDFPDEVREKKPFYINANVKNMLRTPLTILFILNFNPNFSVIYPKNSSRLVYLEPFEDKQLTYYIVGDNIYVPENYFGVYCFTLISQLLDVSSTFNIYKSKGFYQDKFILETPLIYFKNNKLFFETKIFNYTKDIINLDFSFNNDGNLKNTEIEILPNTTFLFSESFEHIRDSFFSFEISGDYSYSSEIKVYNDLFLEDTFKDIIDDSFQEQDDPSQEQDDSQDLDDVFWNNVNIEDIEGSKNYNSIIGIIIIVCFVALTVFIFVRRDKKK